MAATGRLKRLGGEVLAASEPLEGPVAVALSGGADSAVLLWVALERDCSPRALHVHHGLPASDKLAEAAAGIAQVLGVSIDVRYVQPTATVRSEAGLRLARYELLMAELKTGEWLATGHTSDDQAETVLANLLRGTGMEGLAGIPRRRFPLVRPLLAVSRSETRELATLLGLPWFEDPTNLDLGPLRNRIRLRLLPLLEAEYNPNLRRRLVATSALAAAEVEEIENQLLPVYTRASSARLAAGALFSTGRKRAADSIRAAVRRLRPPYPPSGDDVQSIFDVLEGRAARSQIGGGLLVRRAGPWLEFVGGDPATSPAAVTWTVPGHLTWEEFELEAVAGTVPPQAYPLSSWMAVVDADKAGSSLTVRPATGKEGDTLAEAGVTAEQRNRWPVVEGQEGVAWIPGVKTYPAVWVESTTERYLSLSCREEGWRW